MNYKLLFKNQKIRFFILNLFWWIPDDLMVRLQYRIKLKRKLNLKTPQRFTEKIQYYKVKYRNPLLHKCVDKYEVREFVKAKGLESILNDLYLVTDDVKNIDYDKLPNKFVIKTTSGSGGQNIIICNNKKYFDTQKVNKEINKWMKIKFSKSFGREWAYEGNKNKIIVEKLLEGNNDNLSGINDYKFFCYDGKVEYIVFDGNRYVEHKRNFYDKNWHYLNVVSDCQSFGDIIKKPPMLNEMKRVAEMLSEDFPYVRVDLYCIDNKIYFGEMTFYPWSGYVSYFPDSFDFELGNKFNYRSMK